MATDDPYSDLFAAAAQPGQQRQPTEPQGGGDPYSDLFEAAGAAPQKPGPFSSVGNALSTLTYPLTLPKRGVDALARGVARAEGINVPDSATTGQMLREAAAGLTGENNGPKTIGSSLAGRGVEFAGDIASDPLTYALAGAGKLTGVAAEAAPFVERGAAAAFAPSMLAGAYNEGSQAVNRIRKEGLTPQAAEELFGAGLSGGMGLLSASHAIHGAPTVPGQEVDPQLVQMAHDAQRAHEAEGHVENPAPPPDVWEGPSPIQEQQPMLRTPDEVRADLLEHQIQTPERQAQADQDLLDQVQAQRAGQPAEAGPAAEAAAGVDAEMQAIGAPKLGEQPTPPAPAPQAAAGLETEPQPIGNAPVSNVAPQEVPGEQPQAPTPAVPPPAETQAGPIPAPQETVTPVDQRVTDRRTGEQPVADDRRTMQRRQVAAEMGLPEDHPAVDRIVNAETEARTDALTGLGNKRVWLDIQKSIEDSGGKDHAVVMDLKKFKPINDTYGHDAGDLVLKRVASVLREELGDDAARFGGDEFGGAVRGLSPEEAQARAEQIRQKLAGSPITLRDPKTGKTVDLPGVEVHIGVGENAQAADAAANAAAAESRKGGRGDQPVDVLPPDAGPKHRVAADAGAGLASRTPELDARTTASEKAASPAGRFTVADPYRSPEITEAAKKTAPFLDSVERVVNRALQRSSARGAFKGLTVDGDVNGVTLGDNRSIRLNVAGAVADAHEKVARLFPDLEGKERDVRVSREIARNVVNVALHEVAHVKLEQMAAKDPALRAEMDAGGHGPAFVNALRQVFSGFAKDFGEMRRHLETALNNDKGAGREAVTDLWRTADEKWQEAGHRDYRSGGPTEAAGLEARGPDVGRADAGPSGGADRAVFPAERDGESAVPAGDAGRGAGLEPGPGADLRGGAPATAAEENGAGAGLRDAGAAAEVGRPRYAAAPSLPPDFEAEPEPAEPAPSRPLVEANVRNLREAEGETPGARPAELSRDEPKTTAELVDEAKRIDQNYTDADFYRQMKKGPLDAAETVAWRNRVDTKAALRGAAQDALEAAKFAGKDTRALENDYANKSIDYMKALKAHVDTGTEQGRALYARNILDKFDPTSPEAVGTKLVKLGLPQEAVAKVVEAVHRGDPQEINRALVQAFKPSVYDKVYEAWISGMLSAPSTTITKSVSDLLSLVGTGLERGATSRLEAARAKWTNSPAERVAGEAWAHFGGMKDGLQDAMANARKAWNEERVPGIEQGGNDPLESGHAPYAIEGGLGKFIRAGYGGGGTRALRAVDAFSKTLARTAEKRVQALRIATREGGTRAEVAARAEQIARTPDNQLASVIGAGKAGDMLSSMDEFMNRATYTAPFGPKMQGVASAINKSGWIGDIIFPFMKVPWNLAVEGAKATPMNLVNVLNKIRTGELKGGAASEALVRPVLGTAAMMGVAMAAADGQVTGNGPEDPNARKAWMAAGNQPYSIKTPAGWVSYKKIEPFATIIGLAADSVEATHEKKKTEMAMKAVSALEAAFTQKTFLTGMEDIGGILKDPIQYGKQFAQDLEGSIVPNIVNKAAQAYDPTVRDSTIRDKNTLLAPITSKVPGLTGYAPAKGDLTGLPVARGGTAAERFLSPFSRSSEPSKYADLEGEMARIGYAPAQPSREFKLPNGKSVELTDQEYDRLLQARSRAADAASRVINSPVYKNAPDTPADAPLRATSPHTKESLIRQYFDRAGQEWRARYGNAIIRRARAEGSV